MRFVIMHQITVYLIQYYGADNVGRAELPAVMYLTNYAMWEQRV